MRLPAFLLVYAALIANPCPGLAEDAKPPAASTINYSAHIQPFFRTYCLGCHNAGEPSGGLDLQSFAGLQAGGDSGETLLVAGKASASRLVQLLEGAAKPQMPPKKSKQPTAEEIALVKLWINQGAKGPAVDVPLPLVPEVPRIEPKVDVLPAITSVAYSPDGTLLAAVRYREVLIFETQHGRLLRSLSGAEDPLNAVAFSPDGQTVAAAGGPAGISGTVHLWSVSGPLLQTIRGHDDSLYGLAFSPDGKQIATGSYDKLIRLWDAESGRELKTLKHHTMSVFQVAFSPDGAYLASVAGDNTVKLWETASGQRLTTLIEPTKGMNTVAFHPRGDELAAAGVDRMLRVWRWNGKNAPLKKSTFAHDAPVLALVYRPDGRTLFTSSEDGRIKAWDAESLRERHIYEPRADWPLALAVSPDGKYLAAGFSSGKLLLFETGGAKQTAEWIPLPDVRTSRAEVEENAVASAEVSAALLVVKSSPVAAAQDVPSSAEEERPNPPSPQLNAVSPRSVQRGTTTTVRLVGRNIWDADQVFIEPAFIQAKLLPGDEKKPNDRSCELTVPAEMPPRVVRMRLHTPLGSTEAKSLWISPFAEVAEKEPNDASDVPVASLPATFSGTINTRGDRDRWSFDVRAGDELVFVLAGAEIGSALNARMSLLDANGKMVAVAERTPARRDPTLGYRFTEAGRYTLQIEDRNFTAGGNHFYLVHAGRFGWITDVFPLAVEQGSPAELQVEGFHLPKSITIAATGTIGTREEIFETAVGPTLNAARIEVSHWPELLEVEPNDTLENSLLVVPVPGAVNGRIEPTEAGSSDVDHVAFDAKKAERLTIEVEARRRGSPLDSVIDVLHADGTPVIQHTLRAVAETYTVLRDHNSRSRGIRLQSWDDFQINDLLLLGEEVVKIEELPLGPDEDVKFFHKNNVRIAQLGSTPQAHALESRAYKIEVHPPGVSFPPNGMPVLQWPYRNDDGGPGYESDSRVLFDVPADGRYLVRVRDVRNLADREFRYRLVIRPRNEDFRIFMNPSNPDVPRGGSRPVTISIDRLDGFDGPVDVRLEGLPLGITATEARIDPLGLDCTVTLTAAADAPVPSAEDSLGLRVIGRATISGKEVEHTTSPPFGSHQVTITSPPDVLVQVEPSIAEIRPGEELRFRVSIERRHGITARIPIDVQNLPHGLRVLDIGLNGVLITEGTTSREFVVRCDPWAEPGRFPFFASARVEAKGNERHASPAVWLEVKSTTPQAAK